MIIAGRLGALICVGDTENVLCWVGGDGFKLDVSQQIDCLSSVRLMVLWWWTKTHPARQFSSTLDATLPTAETGTRYRTVARMSLLTKSIVAVSSRSLITVYVDGHA